MANPILASAEPLHVQFEASMLVQAGVATIYAQRYAPILGEALFAYKITTRPRLIHFLAQVCHESWALSRTTENLNYTPQAALDTFNKKRIRITPVQANQYCRTDQHKANQEMIANIVYAGMEGNGNVASGDGWRYRGRGPMQLTLKNNYISFTKYTGIDYVNNPDWVTRPYDGIVSACWYWNSRGISAIADMNIPEQQKLLLIRKKVNGGTNGIDDCRNWVQKWSRIIQ